jgi:hypothetical protein
MTKLMFPSSRSLNAAVAALLFCVALTVTACNTASQLVEAARIERLKPQETRLRDIETARAQKIAQLNETRSLTEARVLRNKAAYLTLLAMKNGAAVAFSEKVSDDERFGSALIGLMGLAYYAVNQQECDNLAADLKENEARERRLRTEIDNLSTEAGHRLVISNSCAETVFLTVSYDDLLLGPARHGQWTVEPGKSIYLKFQDFFLRSGVSRVLFYGKSSPSGLEWKGDNNVQIEGRTVPMQALSLDLDENSNWKLDLTCK